MSIGVKSYTLLVLVLGLTVRSECAQVHNRRDVIEQADVISAENQKSDQLQHDVLIHKEPQNLEDNQRDRTGRILELSDLNQAMKMVAESIGGIFPFNQRQAMQKKALSTEVEEPQKVVPSPMHRILTMQRQLLGALAGDNECWEQLLCYTGSMFSGFRDMRLVFGVAERFTPDVLNNSLQIIRRSAIEGDNCAAYHCLDN